GNLGEQTRFAYARDGEEGFWVSFYIDEDEFWVMLPRERFEPFFGLQWLGWLAAVLVLALAGAYLIASNISRPLFAMRRAAERIGRGQPHEALPEEGVRELRTVSAAINRMASDLQAMERERAMVLAGISHDVRTPLSRLRLALEMSGAPGDEMQHSRDAMVADIEEIDAIIGQFLDFARGADEDKAPNDLNEVLTELGEHYARINHKVHVAPGHVPPFRFARMAVRRAIANLVDNALRYAGEPVEVEARAEGAQVIVEVRDQGPGIPAHEAERLKRPFARLDDSRAGPGGSGLGLAIVERIAQAHGGRLDLLQRERGLAARLTLNATA